MIDLLREREMTANDLSRELGIREREVHPHLSHISRTLASGGEKLSIIPAECLACEFEFKEIMAPIKNYFFKPHQGFVLCELDFFSALS